MKKQLFILLLLCISLTSNAQDRDQNIGLRFGYINSNMNNVDGDSYGKSQDGFYVAAYKDVKLMPFLFVQSGLEFTQMGAEVGNSDYKVNYLGVPAALKVKVGPVFAFGGGAFNFRLSDNENPFSDNNKWFDTNAFAGVGVEILMFTVDAKYIWGLTDVNSGLNNDGLQLGVGLRF